MPEEAIADAVKKEEQVIPSPAPKQRKKTARQPAADEAAIQKEPAQQAEGTGKAESQATNLELNKENTMLFGKYPLNAIVITDQSMLGQVRFNLQPYPNIFGRRKRKSYYEAHISIVERLINKLMRGGTGKKVGGKVIRTNGRLQGKKLKVMHIVEDSFEIISKRSGKNPVQVFVDALQNSAPIEDTTRVRYGGISYNVAVGISAGRRVDVALKNIALASFIGAFKKRKSLSEALAEELILASHNSAESYAIKKRVEGERIARRAR